MRKNARVLLMLLAMMVSGICITSCSDTDDGSFVAPITLGEKIAGQWQLNSITQIDEANGKTMDLTGHFDFATLGMSLGNDGTFSVSGSAPAFFPSSGKWKMSNDFVNSDGSAAQIILNDAVGLTVTAVPTDAASHLKFKLTRKSKGVAIVSYEYDLVKLNAEE